jgi:hypothetical protein
MKLIEDDMPMAERMAWVTGLINQIKEGGVWVIPRSSCGYVIYHSQKSVARIGCGDGPTEEVFEQMGWKVG